MLSKKKLDALLERSRWLANGELPSHVVFARLVIAEALRKERTRILSNPARAMRWPYELSQAAKQAAQAAKEGR